MVWLHGGAWSNCAGTAPGFDGTNLARGGDVVVVTVNHRAERIRLSLSRRAGPALRGFRQCRPVRRGRRAPLGPRQHRGVRRRPRQCDAFWPVGRRGEGSGNDGFSSRAWPLSQGRNRELLWRHPSGKPRRSRQTSASAVRAPGHRGSRPCKAADGADGSVDRRDENGPGSVSPGLSMVAASRGIRSIRARPRSRPVCRC